MCVCIIVMLYLIYIVLCVYVCVYYSHAVPDIYCTLCMCVCVFDVFCVVESKRKRGDTNDEKDVPQTDPVSDDEGVVNDIDEYFEAGRDTRQTEQEVSNNSSMYCSIILDDNSSMYMYCMIQVCDDDSSVYCMI